MQTELKDGNILTANDGGAGEGRKRELWAPVPSKESQKSSGDSRESKICEGELSPIPDARLRSLC